VAKPRSWHGQVVLTSDDREYSAISSYPRERAISPRPQPGARADAPAGCGVALLVVGLVLTLAGLAVAYLALTP